MKARDWGVSTLIAAIAFAISGTEGTTNAAEPGKDTGAGEKAGDERDDNGLKLKLIWCPPGEFLMGSPADEKGRDDNEDRVKVKLTRGFWLGKYEVMQSEYQQVMGANPSMFSAGGPGRSSLKGLDSAKFPVERVLWEDALEFCQKFTEQERKAGRLPREWEYTLPTEAQWEYACRAGTTTVYSFGDSLNGDSANCNGTRPHGTETKGKFLKRAATVGSYDPNNWGLHDMHGNVWEWCLDFYNRKLADDSDPFVASGLLRIYRGGDFSCAAIFCRSACRTGSPFRQRVAFQGFRVALSSLPAERVLPSTNAEPVAEGANAGDQRDDNVLRITLVWCPPGEFLMGSPASEKDRNDDEDQVMVRLTKGFWLGMYEVTQSDYQQFRKENPSTYSPRNLAELKGLAPRFPVEEVSWEDAMSFCQKFTKLERTAGRLPQEWEYTLPTEAQWEYACRAGTTTSFNFGKSLNGDKANCDGRSPYGTDTLGKFLSRPTTVAAYGKNPWGLYDMHGNVDEWCLDAYQKAFPGGSDPFVEEGSNRVVRGGDWQCGAAFCRSAVRFQDQPTWKRDQLGFRMALCPLRSKQ
jgi:formylglycine-generating enzyme required for sulfatase activity